MQENMVQTLSYDAQCCHVQGDCEWVACQDSIAVAMYGGTIGTHVAGVYIGSDAAVRVPQQLATHDNTTLLVFQAYNVTHSAISVGTPAHEHLRVVCLSPDGCQIVMTGGWWLLQNQNVRKPV